METVFKIDFNEREKLGPWKKYLDDTPEADSLAQADNLFDLIEQSVIDEDCEAVIDELDIPEESEQKVFETIRLIITLYSKIEKKRYKIGNGWIPLLSRLVKIPSNKLDTYVAFKSIRDNYVPEPGTHGYILHLLLMYHDPELCNLLDTDNFPLNKYTEYWFNSLLAGACVETVLKLLWQSLFKASDSYKIFFIVLSIIITKRAKIIKIKSNNNENIKNTIKNFLYSMDLLQIKNILLLADTLDMNTPSFFKEFFQKFLFGSERKELTYTSPKYLPSSASQVISNINSVSRNPDYYYFIADCRPQMLYFESGRFGFERNFFINCNSVNAATPTYLETVSERFLSIIQDYKVKEPNKIKHICVMGSGLVEDDPCVKHVVTSLLRKNTKYVSVLFGGYHTVHQLLKQKNELNKLTNHIRTECILCDPGLLDPERFKQSEDNVELRRGNKIESEYVEESTTESDSNFSSRFRRRFSLTGQEIKNRMITSPNARLSYHEGKSQGTSKFSRISSDINNIYRSLTRRKNRGKVANSDVHGIINSDRDTASNISTKSDKAQSVPHIYPIMIDQWVRTSDEKIFNCEEICQNGVTYPSLLVVSLTNLFLLRIIVQQPENKLFLVLSCPLYYILKITGKSNREDHITIFLDMTKRIPVPMEEVTLQIPEKDEFINLIHKKTSIKERNRI